jgi:diguanylate cyclase (GGDEF)-like protein
VEQRNSLNLKLTSDDLPGLNILDQVSAQLASAQVVLKAGISWIFTLGIQADMPFYQVKNLALINRVTFTSLLLALPGSFILMLAGFNYTFSILVLGALTLCLILVLNWYHQVQFAQSIFAFSPAMTIVIYSILELSSGGLTDPLMVVLVRQGLCLALLLPIMIYGFERSRKWTVFGVCVIIFLFFDVISTRMGGTRLNNVIGMSQGLFSVLSVLQFTGLAASLLYLQGYTIKHEQQVRQSNEKLHSQVIRDGMTGIFNHSFMEQLIGDAINRSKRSKTPLSLLMIDVDFFKQVNDTLGHNAGDEVLKQIVQLLEGCKRSTDYLGRWGGDELVMLLTDTNLQGAASLAEKLRNLVGNHTFQNHRRLTISLGASEYGSQDTVAGFIERADTAMYRAKRGGRNRVGIQ